MKRLTDLFIKLVKAFKQPKGNSNDMRHKEDDDQLIYHILEWYMKGHEYAHDREHKLSSNAMGDGIAKAFEIIAQLKIALLELQRKCAALIHAIDPIAREIMADAMSRSTQGWKNQVQTSNEDIFADWVLLYLSRVLLH
jgi:hypothetical protein